MRISLIAAALALLVIGAIFIDAQSSNDDENESTTSIAYATRGKKESPKSLHELAVRLNKYASFAKDNTKSYLAETAVELERLSVRQKAGSPPITKEEKELALARAYHAFAAFNFQAARHGWKSQQGSRTAIELNSTAVFLQQAESYASTYLLEEEAALLDASIQNAERIATQVADNAIANPDSVEKQLESLSEDIWILAKKIGH